MQLRDDLVNEWHPTKNLPLTVKSSLNIKGKYWWLGECGHEWDALLDGRFRGGGCPICAGKIVLAGFNDLSTKKPTLAAEWHPTKNGNINPQQVAGGTHKKAWWLGAECGHEWEASISNRVKGRGCPVCAGYLIVPGYNDLATVNPVLAAEWHLIKNGSLTPQQIASGTAKKYWWVGKCGHEWEASPNNRNKGRGCPICSGNSILVGFNDFVTTHPELVAEWHPNRNSLPATQVTAGMEKRVWWLGKNCGHEWEARISDRTRGSSNCPACLPKRKISVESNDLASVYPVLAAEWHPTRNGKLTPDQVTSGTNKKVWWRGAECGHEWETKVRIRVKGASCPACMGNKVISGFNDLATKKPILASEWHPTKNIELFPNMVTIGTSKKVWWRGAECGHEWEARISDRTKGSGCAVCKGRIILAGFNDLASLNPILAAEWHPTKNGSLTTKRIGSTNRKVWWLGADCGHEWEARIYDRAKGSGCAICSGKIVLAGFNDLASLNPILAAEWHPTKNGDVLPEEVIAGSFRKVWWLGTDCGHEWEAALVSRSFAKTGCNICSNYNVLIGFNDMLTTHPFMAAEWHPTKNGELTPEQVIAGTPTNYWWQCSKGHEWAASPARRSRGDGCPKCSRIVSKPEKQIQTFITSLELVTEGSNRTILGGKEIDIWIPEKFLGIEFNGIYWHTETKKGKTSHYDKWLAAKNKGIQLIQIWEDDWNLRPEIILRALVLKLGVTETDSAVQKNTVIHVTEQQAEKFLKENHLHGFASGAYYLGLVQTGDIDSLQAVMVLDVEPNRDSSLEIIRYASIANVNEDFSKMLSYSINSYTPHSIIVIADHCEANEKLYANNDFIVEKVLPPDYMYVVRNERKPRSEYPLERFQSDPKLLWEEGLTEMELADLNGLDRIWDAGKTLYRLVV